MLPAYQPIGSVQLADDDSSLTQSEYLKTRAARHPVSIGVGAGAAGVVGYKVVYPRAVRRFGAKSRNAILLSLAGGLVAGVIAHGTTSFVIYKIG